MHRRPRNQNRQVTRLISWIALYLVEQMLPEFRFGGSHIRLYIFLPGALLIWALTSEDFNFGRRVARLYWTLRHHYFIRVALTGAAAWILLMAGLIAVLTIPAPQPRGHGRLTGSVPLPPPQQITFPTPAIVPPPEVIETRRPESAAQRKPRTSPAVADVRVQEIEEEIPLQSVGDSIAQLPLLPVAENETAPYLDIPRSRPTAPFNLRVVASEKR